MSEEPTSKRSTDEMLASLRNHRIADFLSEHPQFAAMIDMLIAYHESAIDQRRRYQIQVVFDRDEIHVQPEKGDARLVPLAHIFLVVWLTKVRDLPKTPVRTKEHLSKIVGWVPHDLEDARAVIAWLKTNAPFLVQDDFETRCLFCVENKRSRNSLYCGLDCKDRISDWLNDLAKCPAHDIEKKMIKRLFDKGLAHKV